MERTWAWAMHGQPMVHGELIRPVKNYALFFHANEVLNDFWNLGFCDKSTKNTLQCVLSRLTRVFPAIWLNFISYAQKYVMRYLKHVRQHYKSNASPPFRYCRENKYHLSGLCSKTMIKMPSKGFNIVKAAKFHGLAMRVTEIHLSDRKRLDIKGHCIQSQLLNPTNRKLFPNVEFAPDINLWVRRKSNHEIQEHAFIIIKALGLLWSFLQLSAHSRQLITYY